MAANLGDAAAEAAGLALKIGSKAADAVLFAEDLAGELPFAGPVLKTLKAISKKVETARSNRKDLRELHERCTYLTACVVVKCRRSNPSSGVDLTPLNGCLEAMAEVTKRCGGRGKVMEILKASSDEVQISALNARINRLTGDVGLAGIAVLDGKADEMRALLRDVLRRMKSPPPKQAKVPNGAPARKSWHVERRQVMENVLNALGLGGKLPRLVGLVGDSGAGKTTTASAVVSSAEVREAFADGILWLAVNDGAKDRLPSLMSQLARMVYEDIGGRVGDPPTPSGDGAAYVKQYVDKGCGGKAYKCLVVADNVWEKEVASALLETGMWVLLSTRNAKVVTGVNGEVVGVAQLSETDSESVLRRAAELSPGVRLPDDAVELIDMCGRVAMELAFVGRWSTVRGREDRSAWSDAADKLRAAMGEVGAGSDHDDVVGIREKRRNAILRAGFEDLAIGSDDARVPRLYLSLAVMPDARAFTLRDAAILLYDRDPRADDEASAKGVVDILERWTILHSTGGGTYRLHDAHSKFARENLMDRGDVRRPALERWEKYISSLEALRSLDPHVLKSLWQAVERVGGHGCGEARPYEAALAQIGESDPLLRQSIEAAACFEEAQANWEGANNMCRRLLEVEERELGAEHPFVANTYASLARYADRLGNSQEGMEWRAKEHQVLSTARVNANRTFADGVAEGPSDAGGLRSLAATMLKLTPEDRREAEQYLRRSLEIQQAMLGADDEEMAATLYQLGAYVRKAGRLEEAEGLLRRCLSILEKTLGHLHERVAATLFELGVCVRKAGRLQEAEQLLSRCLEIEETTLGHEHAWVAATLQQLGACVREAGRPEEAEQLLRRCLSIQKTTLGAEHQCVAATLYELGVYVRKAGRLQEATQLLRRCLSIEEATLGNMHAHVAATLFELGVCGWRAGRSEQAEQLLRRCLSIEETTLGHEHEQVAITLQYLGVCSRERGRLGEAEQWLRRCLSIYETTLGHEGKRVVITLHHLGVCIRERGQLEEAEQLLRRCLSIEEATLGQEHERVAATLHELGVCVGKAGRPKEAEQLLRRCLSIEEATLGHGHERVAATLYELVVWVHEEGRSDEAAQLLSRGRSIARQHASAGGRHAAPPW